MKIADCYFLGTIIKKNGYKGHLIIKLDTDEPESYKNLESILVLKDGILVPFFLETTRLQPKGFLKVKIEGIDHEDQAMSFLKNKIYLPLTKLPELTEKQFYFHEVVGYEIIDQNYGLVGTITEINDSTPQALFIIDSNTKEVIIPIVDEWIMEINKEGKRITVKVPDGLIEMYLE